MDFDSLGASWYHVSSFEVMPSKPPPTSMSFRIVADVRVA